MKLKRQRISLRIIPLEEINVKGEGQEPKVVMSGDANGRCQTHRVLRSNTGHLGAGSALRGLQPSLVLQMDKPCACSPEGQLTFSLQMYVPQAG